MSYYGDAPIAFESVSAVTATPTPGVDLGTVRTHAGEVYEYVFAAKTISMGVGAVKTGTSGYTVVATGAVSGEFCAGVCKHESITSGYYGWILKKGVVDMRNAKASSAPVIDEPAYLGSDGGFMNERTTVTNAVNNGHCIGKVLSAGASGGTGASYSLMYISV